MATTLKQIVTHNNINQFFLDLSGVIYNDNGFIKDIGNTVSWLQSHGEVFIASNNSTHGPTKIFNRLASANIKIPIEKTRTY